MRDFAALFTALDASTATGDKLAALKAYFARAEAADAAWATYYLCGGKPRQVVPTAVLRKLACRLAGIEDWLFEACYQAAGDLAETIAQVLPPGEVGHDLPLARWVEDRLLSLRQKTPDEQAALIARWWAELDAPGRFLLTKLIGGGFRVGVSKLLVQRALAEGAGLVAAVVAERMMGYTDARRSPTAEAWRSLVRPASTAAVPPLGPDGLPLDSRDPDAAVLPRLDGQPYPFFLAHPMDLPLAAMTERLGPCGNWQVEWKFDGIRAQVVRRGADAWIWSRGEELVTERFPEVRALAGRLPDGTVLDGELLVLEPGPTLRPAPFAQLQRRIGRKLLGKRILAEVPVDFIAYDLLELGGRDLRSLPLHERRDALERLAGEALVRVSERVSAEDWATLDLLRQQARERRVEGFMLKHRESVYGMGRRRDPGSGGWLKWKLAPMTVDAVLIYAQAGHGRRASLYTDYTFAVWNRPPHDAAEAQRALQAPAAAATPPAGAATGETPLTLVPVAKAYSGLTDAEIARVDAVIRRTTREKFGPVRSVQPTLMFELGFEGINHSPRHRSGVALRFPRMLRIREDKPLHEADVLDNLLRLIG